MDKYIPSPRDWAREQVELYEIAAAPKAPLCGTPAYL